MDKTKKRFLGIGVLAAIAVITFAFAITASGSDGGVIDQNAEGVTVAASEVTSSINYQGRLADSEGEPLSGTYSMTFSLYEVVSGGTALDTDTNTVEVTDGLFNTEIDFNQSYFDGRELWLGITVGGDAEMTPRQEFKPVPYALSLKPGAEIKGETDDPVIKAENTGDGAGVSGIATGYGGIGVHGQGGLGTGVRGEGEIGVSGKSGMGPGVTGEGVVGVQGKSDVGSGVSGTSTSSYGYGVYGQGGKYGGYFTTNQAGTSGNNNAGVNATTTYDYSSGVRASTSGNNSDGVSAYSDKGYGVRGSGSKGGGYFTQVQQGMGFFWREKNAGVFGAGKYGGYFTTNQAGTSGNNNAGVNATTAYDYSDGVRASTSGDRSYGVRASTSGDRSYGVRASTSGDNSRGVSASTRGDYSRGVSVSTTGDNSDGVVASTYGEDSDGVDAYSSKRYGVYAATGRSDHKYGVKTPDKMCAMSYDTGCADVAEYFPVAEDPEPGTVMVIREDSKLQSSTTAYDTTVAGIVSTSPGVSLGTKEDGNDGEKLIAVAGRVPCKVDASYAAIMPGDLLTTSDTPGHAMKATDLKIGTIVGKALEPLDSGTCVIEVLVTLQ